jgi:chromosomal replication initiator protein
MQEVVMEDSLVAAALSSQLAERIGAQRFERWFSSQAEFCVRASALTVRAASAFVRDWLRNNFADDIRACWEAIVGSAGTVEFDLDATLGPANSSSPAVPESGRRDKQPSSQSDGKATPKSHARVAPAEVPGTARNVSLAGFVVGKSNEYAFRTAELTARGLQQASPVVFCGSTGVGKTHLLRAILQEYRRHHPRSAAVFLTAEQFTTGFIEALRGSGLPSFRQKCRGAKILAIDDLQFFVGKQRTIEELLYTLDTLAAEGRQLVLASDRRLAELRALGPELISRISGGLICEMEPPEYATRLGIARQLAQEMGLDFDDEVASLIATQITAGARELQGAIHRLKATSEAYNEPISKGLAGRALAEMARHSTRTVRLADVQKVVCDAFGVEPAQLRSDRKARALAEPRMLAMWLARKYTRAPWSEIGQFFGRHSHSTVISAHRRVEKLIATQGHVGMADQDCNVDEAIRRLELALRTA